MKIKKVIRLSILMLLHLAAIIYASGSGRYDDVNVLSLHSGKKCKACMSCPIKTVLTGECGEIFTKNLLKKRGFSVYPAQYNSSGHGIDLIAIKMKDFRMPNGTIQSIPLILFHESKSTSRSKMSEREFYRRLGPTKDGVQCSRTWINNALAQMKLCENRAISKLAIRVEKLFDRGAYFVRTGNIKADSLVEESSYLRFYVLRDRSDKSNEIGDDMEDKPMSGPLGKYWSNGHKDGFKPFGKELKNDSYLRRIFDII